jgi:hypothetical protein
MAKVHFAQTRVLLSVHQKPMLTAGVFATFWTLSRTRVARCYVFITKTFNLGKFWRVLAMDDARCWYILWPFGQFSSHLVYFMALVFVVIWYIFPILGVLYPGKSGNPRERCD